MDEDMIEGEEELDVNGLPLDADEDEDGLDEEEDSQEDAEDPTLI